MSVTKNRRGLLLAVVLMVLLMAVLGIIVTTTSMKQTDFGLRKKAAAYKPPTDLPFAASVSQSQISPGETVMVTLMDSAVNPLPYKGYVFVKSQTCDETGECSNYTGEFKDYSGNPVYFNNGLGVMPTSPDLASGLISLRFSTTNPVRKTDWSNEVRVRVGNGLVEPTIAPLPTAIPTAVPTLAPTATPVPTPVVKTLIRLNTGDGSCNSVCSAIGYNCASVGSDTGGSNGQYYSATSQSRSSCVTKGPIGCSYALVDKGVTCSNYQAEWTNCLCTTAVVIDDPVIYY